MPLRDFLLVTGVSDQIMAGKHVEFVSHEDLPNKIGPGPFEDEPWGELVKYGTSVPLARAMKEELALARGEKPPEDPPSAGGEKRDDQEDKEEEAEQLPQYETLDAFFVHRLCQSCKCFSLEIIMEMKSMVRKLGGPR